jgi:integrase
MPRLAHDAKLRSRSSRRPLAQAPQPYYTKLLKGLALGYRKGAKGGTWIARRHEGGTKYSFQPLGVADDHADADGVAVLSFDQAQEQARSWFQRRAHEDAGSVQTGPYTVAQAMEDYITERERVKRKSFARTRTIIAAHILPTLGSLDVNKLTHGKLKTWRDSLQTAAPRLRSKLGKPQAFREFDATDEDAVRARQATANRVLTTLKAALNYAHGETHRIGSNTAWINVKPFRNVDVPKVRFLTPQEAQSLVGACAPDFALLVQAAFLTGCRYGELKAMEVAAFDCNNESMFISKSKNDQARHVLLNAEGVAFFQQLTHGKAAKDRMFLRANGRAWEDSEQKRPMDAACEVAQLEHVTFHILRHTYASQLAMNGAPMKFIADQLGHKSTHITERHYAHLGDAYKRLTIQRTLPSFGFPRPSKPGTGA